MRTELNDADKLEILSEWFDIIDKQVINKGYSILNGVNYGPTSDEVQVSLRQMVKILRSEHKGNIPAKQRTYNGGF